MTHHNRHRVMFNDFQTKGEAMAEKKRKGGGGKLARTENVQVRLDPKLRFAAELAAGKERRTLSSFVEWAVERAVKEVSVTLDENGEQVSAAEVTERTWDVDESDRFVNLAWQHPGLLTHNEQRKWKFICETAEFWQGTVIELDKDQRRQDFGIISAHQSEDKFSAARLELNRPLLRAAWVLIEKHISGGDVFDTNAFHALLQENPPSGIPISYGEHTPTIYLLRNKLEQDVKRDSEWVKQASTQGKE